MVDPFRVEGVFLAAQEMRTPEERAAYLDDVCRDDPKLRQRVEELLAARRGEDGDAVASTREHVGASTETIGSRIGPYKLLQRLGEGGMGTVYTAEQEHPVKRRVALKIIKTGMDSVQVVARFEQERQALAMMDHPNIAKVLDAGATETGRPYFVMELVKGIPITRFCDQEHLTPQERLELFVPVCQAVQHAHQKGIIHRDLKPSNVLIALYDGKAVPKVIDFGVAKATHQKLTERTMFTEVGSIVGTLEYMAPEQAELNNLDIDTRADIYSLGVLLYELLTGSPPFSSKQLRGAAFAEMLRMIREVEPPKPSTRLSSSNELPSIAANRKLEPRRLTSLLTGELDWIVMKALEKDRGRRHETANGLAMDIGRYLADEPVLASPPSAAYRMKKFVRRNKGPVAAAVGLLLALSAGVVGTTIGLLRAEKAWEAEAEQRQIAQTKEQEALAEKAKALEAAEQERLAKEGEAEQRVRAEVNEKQAITEKRIAEAVRTFLQRDLLRQADATEQANALRQLGGGFQAMENPTIKELLDRAAEGLAADRIESKFPGQQEVQAEILKTVGDTYLGIGEFAQAISFLERSVELYRLTIGPEEDATLNSQNSLAGAYREAGKLDLALPLMEETLKLRKAKLGPEHPDTLASINNLATAYQDAGKLNLALPLSEETLKHQKAKLGPDHPHTLLSMANLAEAYRVAGKLDLALPLIEETLKRRKATLGPEHPSTLTNINNLAGAYREADKLDLAVPLFEETLKLFKAKLGPKHPDTLMCMGNLAEAYRDAGNLALALPLSEETLKLRKAKLGPEHPDTLTSMNNLATTYQAAGNLALALPLFEETLKVRKATLGPEYPNTLTSMNNLATAYQAVGKLALALPLFEETLKLRKAKLGPEHPDTLTSMKNLGVAYREAGKLDLALPLMEETLKLRKAKLGPEHPDTLTSIASLARAYRAAGKPEQALPLFLQAAKGIEKRKFLHVHAGPIFDELIACYEQRNQYAEAEEWRRKWLAVVKERAGVEHPAYAGDLALLGGNLLKQQEWTDAEPVLRECLTLREKLAADANPQVLPWQVANTRSLLGQALAGQEKYAEAEPLLLAGHAGLKEHEATIPPEGKVRLTEALQRLVDFYTATGQREKSDEWRKKLDESKAAEEKPEP